jgi:hypothetical protein
MLGKSMREGEAPARRPASRKQRAAARENPRFYVERAGIRAGAGLGWPVKLVRMSGVT